MKYLTLIVVLLALLGCSQSEDERITCKGGSGPNDMPAFFAGTEAFIIQRRLLWNYVILDDCPRPKQYPSTCKVSAKIENNMLVKWSIVVPPHTHPKGYFKGDTFDYTYNLVSRRLHYGSGSLGSLTCQVIK